jgi:hypothetical protein
VSTDGLRGSAGGFAPPPSAGREGRRTNAAHDARSTQTDSRLLAIFPRGASRPTVIEGAAAERGRRRPRCAFRRSPAGATRRREGRQRGIAIGSPPASLFLSEWSPLGAVPPVARGFLAGAARDHVPRGEFTRSGFAHTLRHAIVQTARAENALAR